MSISTLTGFPPKVFLIGAQKAGTTFLAGLLDQHPDIQVASPKEPHYFTRNRERGAEWYSRCFPDSSDGVVLVDASPSYSAAPIQDGTVEHRALDSPYIGVPARIAELVPDAQFIYLVRDPVARIHSGYWHAVRTGAERLAFEEAIAPGSHYRRVSDYHQQLRLYREHFLAERFLILRFEDLVHDPEVAVKRCTEFMGLDELARLNTTHGQNRSALYSGSARALDLTLSPAGGLKAATAVGKRVLPVSMQQWLRKKLTSSIPAMPLDIRERLLEEYRPMAVQFETETGVRLYPWAGESEK